MGKRIAIWSGLALLVLAAIGVGYLAWERSRIPPPAVVAAPVRPIEPAASVAAPPASAAIRYPIETPATTAASAPATDPEAALKAALDQLLGARAVLSFLQTDGWAARFVATVDNLDREHATPRLWPVNPTAGRFTVQASGGAEVIAAANAARYQPLVRLIDGVDTARALALYRRFYPQLQQAYVALGYPQRYFNDRLVDVIDHLLAAPSPAEPVAVRPVEVKGPIPAARPWTHYEFADPALESASAGHKLMARIGDDNARRLKAKLAEFRRGLIAGAPAR